MRNGADIGKGTDMDEKTSVLVCLGAAVAANCVACFRHYHGEALRLGLDGSEIQAAVTLAGKVKAGANIAVMSAVGESMRGAGQQPAEACSPASAPSCCSRNG
jgi:alkylhydroperoxidase/carboxymuconolactone decarboxylase family protein YurZ